MNENRKKEELDIMTAEAILEIESRFVRAKEVPVSELREGMRCASDVRTRTGTVILPRDSEIQEKHIEFFAAVGVEKVDVIVPKKETPRPEITGETDRAEIKPLKRVRVLVVDDSRMMRVSLRKILEGMGSEIVGEAGDGIEALELAREHSPEIALLDIKMPRMDGIETVKSLAREFPKLKIIMVSTVGEEDKIVECIKSGASDFIQKPFNPTRVRKSVANAIGNGFRDS